ncbi:MAG: UvrD-helicase domain-containing protein [Phycisphaerae bacterium]
MSRHCYDNLTSSQLQAVRHKEGPLLVIAGPGSGKTRVITYRIAALIDSGVNPRNICAITFTNKAAEEMRQRTFSLVPNSGTHISTFHSLCVRILRRYHEQAGIRANFSIYSESEQTTCIKNAIKECELETGNFPPARTREAISTLKNKLIDSESYKEQAEDFFTKALAKIYSRYQHLLQVNNSLDFDDLLMKTALLLEKDSDIRKELSNRFRFLLIDEYQDTNHAQYCIAKNLVCEHNNICVTGDPDQSIYRWRGADIRNILAFEKDWPDAVVIKLEENFRSTPNILSLADRLIAVNQNRKPKTLIPTKKNGSDVSIICFDDHNVESQGIAEKIIELSKSGISLRNIAVFYRINSASRPLEEAFIKNKIPYQIVRGVEFYNRKEIRDILAYLKILVNPQDEVACLRIINTPARGIGKSSTERILAYAARKKISFFEALKKSADVSELSNSSKIKIKVFVEMLESFTAAANGPVAPLVERVFVDSGLEASLKKGGDNDAIENINELINSAAVYDGQSQEPSLLDYLQQIALFSDADSYDTAQDKVALMTLHAAKGLEFDNIFIIGLEDGLLPHERSSDNDDELEEERRLFFVGITRARQFLQISYAKYRIFRGQLMRTVPSQFLYEIGVDFGKLQKSETAEDDYCDDIEEPYRIEAQFTSNQLVRHKKFGLGRVKQFLEMGDNSTITIRFDDGRIKTLMLKYANLEVIDT